MLRKTFIDIDTESDDDNPPMMINVYVTGYPKTGKTSIVKRIALNSFNIIESSTKCIEIYKEIKLNHRFKIKIWDVPYHLFDTIQLHVNDLVLYVVRDKIPPMPKTPVRLWLISRYDLKTNVPFIKVDAMSNTGIKDLIKKIIRNFS